MWKWASCDNPEYAASCQAVQDKQLAQVKLQLLRCQEELKTGAEGGSKELQNMGSLQRECYK